MAIDLTKLQNKIDNNDTDQGVLRAEEFNNLVRAVIDNQNELKGVVKSVRYGASGVINTPDNNGLVTIPSDAANKYKFSMISPNGDYKTYSEYIDSFPQYILLGESFSVQVRISFTENIDGVDEPSKTPLRVNFKVGSSIAYYADIYDFNLKDSLITDSQKTVTFNFAKYLASNSNNTISIEIVDTLQPARIAPEIRQFNTVYVVNAKADVKLEGTVNNLNIYNSSSLYSDTSKIVINTTSNSGKLSLYSTTSPNPIYVKENIDTTTTSIQLNNASLDNSIKQHGTHTIYAVLKYTIPGQTATIDVKSNEISYIFYDESTQQTEPLVSINKVSTELVFKEYSQIILNYLVYLPENYTGAKDIRLFTTDNSSNIIIDRSYTIIPEVISNRIITGNISYLLSHKDKGKQIESGKYNLNIEFDSFEEIIGVEIEKSSINLENYNIRGAKIYLKSSDKSAGDKSWQYIYNDEDNHKTETYDVVFNNFDFTEFGSAFKSDNTIDGGQTVLSIKRNSSIEIPYAIFGKPLQLESEQGGETGKTISIEFKTYNCISQVKPIITCADLDIPESDIVGFIAYPNKVIVKTRTSTFEAKYKEDEQIKLDIVVEGNYTEYNNPTVSGEKGENVAEGDDAKSSEALIIIYVNGVYQRLHKIDGIPGTLATDTFSIYQKDGEFVQNNSHIIIGSEGCDIDLYNVKLYEKPLSAKEIVFNYGFDTPRFEDRIAIISRNDIWTNDVNEISKLYDIDRVKLGENLPNLPIFSFAMHASAKDVLPVDKKNWKFLDKNTYYNKNIVSNSSSVGNNSFSVNSAAFRNQGTSSMNYPMPWRNWDWKTDTDVATESGAVKEGDPILSTLSKKFFTYDGTQELEKTWKQYDNMPDGIRKITFKKDYASSEMCNNAICSSLFTDMAIIAGSNQAFKNTLMPTGKLDKYGHRLSLIAIPCFMYQELTGENEGKTKTLGMMNLIPNKNETSYLGLGDDATREWNILKILSEDKQSLYNGNSRIPRTQAWEVSENHVIWDTKYESYILSNVIANSESYPNIYYIDNTSIYINSVNLNNDDKHDEEISRFLDLLLELNTDINYENLTSYEYYIVFDQTTEKYIFIKIIDKNADNIGKDDYAPKYEIELFGTYINSVKDNYEARYPKDSSGVEISTAENGKINIWGNGKEADFGFAPDTDWMFTETTHDETVHIDNETTKNVKVSQMSIIEAETRDILRLHNWLVDCHPAKAIKGNTITIKGKQEPVEDTIQNRLIKFKTEAEDYLIIEQWILYYLWRELFWMFDSGSKNLQLYSVDGMRWGCMVRDADTALGINNLGVEMFPPYLEDVDYYSETVEDGIKFYFNDAKHAYSIDDVRKIHTDNNRKGVASAVLNGQFGSIWLNLRDSYKTEIHNMANVLFSSTNKLTAKNTIAEFDNHQDNWSESLYNFGMRQYFGGDLFTKWINSGNGNKRLSRKDWLTKAFDYRLGKYKCYPEDNQVCCINWRAAVLTSSAGNGNLNDIETENFKFKFYQPCYLWGGSSSSTNSEQTEFIRVTAFGDEITNIPISKFSKTSGGSGEGNTYLYGMHNVTDMGPLYKTVVLNDFNPFNALTKVTKLEIGHKEWSISNGVKYEELGTLPLNGMSKLQYLDITNYNKVTKLNIDKCTQLEELYMRGTDGLTSIILPKTITLKNIEFGKNISVLDVSNLIGLQSINFESTANLTELTAVNCSEYMKKESYNIISNSPKLTKANLDINWGSIDSPIKIDNFYKIAMKKDIILRGVVVVDNMSFNQKLDLISKFGNIDFNSEITDLKIICKTHIGIGSISAAPKILYAGKIDSLYTISFDPDNLSANNMLRVEWTAEGNFNKYLLAVDDLGNGINISKASGKLTVKRIGDIVNEPVEGETPEEIIITAKLFTTKKLTDGSIIENPDPITDTIKIRLYERKSKVGDLVYHDGTYLSYNEHDNSKEVVGICFYVEENPEPGTEPLRLMVHPSMVLKNGNDITGLQFGLAASSEGIDNLDGNIYNIESIKDVASTIASYNSWDEYKTNSGKWNFGNEFDNNSGKQHSIYHIGVKETIDGNKITYGEYNSNEVIKHRNNLLLTLGVKTPQEKYDEQGEDKIKTEIQVTSDCIIPLLANTEFSTTSIYDKLDDNEKNKCHLFYYPVFSMAYAYEPVLTIKNLTLADKFKAHNWFIPSAGEALRLLYYVNMYINHKYETNEYPDDIFKPIVNANIINVNGVSFGNILNNLTNEIHTSSECGDNNYITITSWNETSFSQYESLKTINSKRCIPICKF